MDAGNYEEPQRTRPATFLAAVLFSIETDEMNPVEFMIIVVRGYRLCHIAIPCALIHQKTSIINKYCFSRCFDFSYRGMKENGFLRHHDHVRSYGIQTVVSDIFGIDPDGTAVYVKK